MTLKGRDKLPHDEVAADRGKTSPVSNNRRRNVHLRGSGSLKKLHDKLEVVMKWLVM